MHYDDRLATVLRFRADGAANMRVQFRQLLDLLGTQPVEAHGPQVDAAYNRLGELAGTIPPADRTAILRDPALRLRTPRLVAALAAGEHDVARAVIERAQLDEDQWLDLIPALPLPARGTMRSRHDLGPCVEGLLARLGIMERGLPPADGSVSAEPAIDTPGPAPLGPEGEGIGALVKRIEAYRKARQVIEHVPAGDAPRLPLGEEHLLRLPIMPQAFDFATDAAGRICWSDPGIAPMAIGLSLAGRDDAAPARLTAAMITAMARRQPIVAGRLNIAGAPAIAGDWQVDASPWFDPASGQFAGYRGRMRRPAALPASAPIAAPVKDSEADRVRQLLHELRTPVNAIQGFAEVIQQQLFGPTPHEYRALAASIAGDAARMLAAFEELERLARLDSGVLELEPGSCDLVAIFTATAEQLEPHTKPRQSGFILHGAADPLLIAVAGIEVERLAWRLLATLAGAAAPGERLALRFKAKKRGMRLRLQLPATLAARDDDALFRAAVGSVPQAISAGVFGVGFALRLARAEARAAGGALERDEGWLELLLPDLTAADTHHSDVLTRDAALPG